MKHIHVFISGNVQGVGFRAWAVQQARELGVAGWVKNREDGTVEIVAEGTKEKLETLIFRCHKGPDTGLVDHVDMSWATATGQWKSFIITY